MKIQKLKKKLHTLTRKELLEISHMAMSELAMRLKDRDAWLRKNGLCEVELDDGRIIIVPRKNIFPNE